MSQDLGTLAGVGGTPSTVVFGLGYPNGRAEVSPSPTGWQVSAVNADGSANQANANVINVSRETLEG